MADNYSIVSGCSYTFILKKGGAHLDLKRLRTYLDSMNDSPGVPKLIFAELIPDLNNLKEIIQAEPKQKSTSFILSIREKGIRSREDYWKLLDLGFEDIIEWDTDDEMITYIQSKVERTKAIADVLTSPLVTENLVGVSIVWKRFLSDLIETTLYSKASVLLIGESGTGKELLSRLIHTIDRRPDKKKLVVVDCTTIVPELSGSELFGHERGSYTNAIQSREGAVALANGGTLFLDEVGELPLNLQAELLRVLQEGTYKKVGSNTWQKTDFRLVCATNKDLTNEVEAGRFRQDLYFRISDCEYHVPSLQQRKDDIPDLVKSFLSRLFTDTVCPEVDKPVLDYLTQRDYPGNIRELKQLVQRIALKHTAHKKITIGEVPLKDRCHHNSPAASSSFYDLESMIRKALLTGASWWNLKNTISETAIQVALDLESNNKQKAADRLGVDVRTVQQYVKKKTE